jgi:long-chain fatty acid transport protein
MKDLKALFICTLLILCISGFASTASATNGYFAHGYSPKNKAQAGAGTALPLDSQAAATNPAGMVFVGAQFDFGISFFNPNREYTVQGDITTAGGLAPGTVESESDWFIIPSIGINRMLNESSSLGFSIYCNGGMNTNYQTSTYAGGTDPTGVELKQIFAVATYAVKAHPKHAFGISPIFAYQMFESSGLSPFSSLSHDSSRLTNNGHEESYGYGGRIGYLGEVLPDLFLGASYQSRIYMEEFDDYAGLFAEDGDFDIPSNWSAGLAYHPTEALTFVFDVQQIYYSEVDSIGNNFEPAYGTCVNTIMSAPASNSPSCLGGDRGVGFGWDDMTIYKAGIQWKSSQAWVWRAGYSYGEQPIDSTEVLFNIIAPAVIEQHATAGFTTRLGEKDEINFSLVRAFSNSVKGQNPNDPNQTIEIQMDQWEITLGYSYNF